MRRLFWLASLFLLLAQSSCSPSQDGNLATPTSSFAQGNPVATALALPRYSIGGKSIGTWIAGSADDIYTFSAIYALSPNDVWAAGQTSSSPTRIALVRWDGSRWSTVVRSDAISPISPNLRPTAIVALTPDNVWVVGSYRVDENLTSTFIAHWNGATLEMAKHPENPGYNNELRAITALGPNDIWTVGSDILHYDGKTWSSLSTLDETAKELQLGGDQKGFLYGMAAISADDIWAVGVMGQEALTIHWDGRKWKRVSALSSPADPSQSSIAWPQNILTSVAMVSSNDAWAVGYYTNNWMGDAAPILEPLLIHWDGKSWTDDTASLTQSLASSHSFADRLTSIVAFGNSDLWIASNSNSPAILIHGDGHTWESSHCLYSETHEYGFEYGFGPGYGLSDSMAKVDKDEVWLAGQFNNGPLSNPPYTGAILDPSDGPCPTPAPFPTLPPIPTIPPPPPQPSAPGSVIYDGTWVAPKAQNTAFVPLPAATYPLPTIPSP